MVEDIYTIKSATIFFVKPIFAFKNNIPEIFKALLYFLQQQNGC
jgi:hypothetical protein